jgi:flagellar basal body-associated protein FliL
MFLPLFIGLHHAAVLRCAKKTDEERDMKDSIWVILLLFGALFVIAYDLFAFVGI